MVVFKILEALVASRYLKNPNIKQQCDRPQAVQRTQRMRHKHGALSPGETPILSVSLSHTLVLVCEETWDWESGHGRHSLCHLGGHGLLIRVASKSQENRPPCTLWRAPLHSRSAHPYSSLGPPGDARPETPRGRPQTREAVCSI